MMPLIPQRCFAIFAAMFGLLFLVLLPPMQAPDETTHFFRSYQVAEGGWTGEKRGTLSGGFLPVGLWTPGKRFDNLPGKPDEKVRPSRGAVLRQLRAPFNREERDFIHFPNTVTYAPIAYLPQAAGIAAGNIFRLSALSLSYLGRLGNLLVWIAMLYVAIRIAPVFKWVFFMLALSPMSLHQAASLSADTFANGLGFLFLAYCLELAYRPDRTMQRRDFVLLPLAVVALSVVKLVYLPMALLLFLIPRSRFASTRQWAAFLAATFAAALTFFLLWSYQMKKVYVPYLQGLNPSLQAETILSHPFQFLGTLLKTFAAYGREYLRQFVGILGWLDTPLPNGLYYLYGSCLLALTLLDRDARISIPGWDKVLLVASGILCIFLMSAGIYTTWNPPGTPLIEGLQGRYFIPFSGNFLLPLYNRREALKASPAVTSWVATLAVPAVLSWTCLVLFKRYYVSG